MASLPFLTFLLTVILAPHLFLLALTGLFTFFALYGLWWVHWLRHRPTVVQLYRNATNIVKFFDRLRRTAPLMVLAWTVVATVLWYTTPGWVAWPLGISAVAFGLSWWHAWVQTFRLIHGPTS